MTIESDLRKQTAALNEQNDALRDAMNNLTQARADVEKVFGNDSAEIMALRAAVDDVTAAVTAATAHGARRAEVTTDKK